MLREEIKTREEEKERLGEVRRVEQLNHCRHMAELNSELNSMTSHAERLDNWVRSLKTQAKQKDTLIASVR